MNLISLSISYTIHCATWSFSSGFPLQLEWSLTELLIQDHVLNQVQKVQVKFLFQVRGDGSLNTPRIDEVLTQFRQRIASETVTDPVTQPDRSQPSCSVVADPADPINEQRIRKLEHQVSQLIQQVLI